VWVLGGATLNGLAVVLSCVLNRNVLDKSAISSKFNIHLEYTPDETTPDQFAALAGIPPQPRDSTGGPNIMTALQEQLGLKLESTKGPHEYIVIEHVERPSEN
jgi:uncharacterized protein (TIGR03435 family)